MLWVLVVLGAMVATATVIAPSMYKNQVFAKAQGEEVMVKRIAQALGAYTRHTQTIPGPNTWDGAAEGELGMDLTSVRQVFPQFPISLNTRRVFLVDPSFQPATGAPILPFTQSALGLDPLSASAPGLNTRLLIASSSVRNLPLPFTSGILPAGLFDSLWGWVPDGTGNSPLASVSPAWAGRGAALHVTQLDLRPLFRTLTFRRLAYSVGGSTPTPVAETAQRLFLVGTTLDLHPLTNTMIAVRHVVREAASFDLSSPYEPLGWWRFEIGMSPSVATNYGRLGDSANAALTNGVGTVSLGPIAPLHSGYPTNNLGLSLDGLDDFLDTRQSLMNALSEFTLACWINLADNLSNTVAFCGQNGLVQLGMSTGNMLTVVTGSAGSISGLYPHSTNAWHHVAVTGDGSQLRLYVDGAVVGTGGSPPPGGSYGSTAAAFSIGGGSVFDSSGNHFAGSLDEVLLFSKALSTTQILGLSVNQVPQ